MLRLQGQDCTCRLRAGPSTTPATGVQIPSGAAFHFDIFPSRLELIRVHDNRCFEPDAEMTVRTAHGLPLVVRMVLKKNEFSKHDLARFSSFSRAMSQPPGLHRNNRITDSVASTCVNYCTCSYINLTNAHLHVICRRHIDLVRHHINLV